MRHGKTFINKYNKMQGWCDTPLTAEGREGAEQAAEALKDLPLDIALSSNTLRASETCEIIMQKNCNKDLLQHLAYPYFREHFYGYFEGMDNDVAWRMVGAAHGFTSADDLAKNATCARLPSFWQQPLRCFSSLAPAWKNMALLSRCFRENFSCSCWASARRAALFRCWHFLGVCLQCCRFCFPFALRRPKSWPGGCRQSARCWGPCCFLHCAGCRFG